MSGSRAGLKKITDPDPVCPERLDPDLVNMRPDPTTAQKTWWCMSIYFMRDSTDDGPRLWVSLWLFQKLGKFAHCNVTVEVAIICLTWTVRYLGIENSHWLLEQILGTLHCRAIVKGTTCKFILNWGLTQKKDHHGLLTAKTASKTEKTQKNTAKIAKTATPQKQVLLVNKRWEKREKK